MAQLVAQLVVRLRHRIQGTGFLRCHQVDGAEPGDRSRHHILHAALETGVEAGRCRTDANHQRRGEGLRGCLQAGGKLPDVRLQAGQIRRPIFQARQYHVHAVAIGRERAGRVQQKLEHLVVRRHSDVVVETQLAHPKRERRFDGIRREGGADDKGRTGHRIHHHYRGRRAVRRGTRATTM